MRARPPDGPADSPPIRNAGGAGGRNGSVRGNVDDPPPLLLSAAVIWRPEPHSRNSRDPEPQNLALTPAKIFEDVQDEFHIAPRPQGSTPRELQLGWKRDPDPLRLDTIRSRWRLRR